LQSNTSKQDAYIRHNVSYY